MGASTPQDLVSGRAVLNVERVKLLHQLQSLAQSLPEYPLDALLQPLPPQGSGGAIPPDPAHPAEAVALDLPLVDGCVTHWLEQLRADPTPPSALADASIRRVEQRRCAIEQALNRVHELLSASGVQEGAPLQ